ncbi:MAG: gamma-glutamyltransferase [Rhodospirillales bacterium]
MTCIGDAAQRRFGGGRQERTRRHAVVARFVGPIAVAAMVAGFAACAPVAAGPAGGPPPLGFAAAARSGAAGVGAGIVAVSEPHAAAAGAEILAAGGNAVDAAAAIQFALNVTEPQSSGIGGGGFALVHLAASGRTVALDFRETAPGAATAGARPPAQPFDIASTSGRAIGVPGTVRGIATALRLWGTAPLASTLAPAIALAEDGFEVGPGLARSLGQGLASGGRLDNERGNPAYDRARQVLAPGGVAPAAGAWLRQPQLARALRLIAAYGPDALYDCASPAGIAEAIVATQRATRVGDPDGRGMMTCDDLAAYEAIVREPVVGTYRGYVVASVPPPSSGGIALLQMLAMLERFPIGAADRADFGFGGYATLNLMQEVMRLAFADRAAFIGDPAFAAVPVAGLLAPDYLAARAASCPEGNAGADAAADPARGRYCVAVGTRLAGIVHGDPNPATHTTHFTVVDHAGNIVAWTGTIEAAWGTGLMVPGFGFLLNNELTDFDGYGRLPPEGAGPAPAPNTIGPGKRPRSSIAPVIVFQGPAHTLRPVAALGSPGGATIPNTVLAVLLNLIDFRMPVQRAIDAPRLSLTSAADGAVTAIEPGFDAAAIARLRSTCSGTASPDAPPACYQLREADAIGSVQAVVLDPTSGRRAGGADRRRDGTVIAVPSTAGAEEETVGPAR